ncbi:MAG: hypothetical protein V4490_02155, partial [Pseudomonadota bacterium]
LSAAHAIRRIQAAQKTTDVSQETSVAVAETVPVHYAGVAARRHAIFSRTDIIQGPKSMCRTAQLTVTPEPNLMALNYPIVRSRS